MAEEHDDEMEKYCPNCDHYHPERWMWDVVRVGILDCMSNDEVLYCSKCGTDLVTRKVKDRLENPDVQCTACNKTIRSTERFCIYCREPNQRYELGHITVSRCPKCNDGVGPEELLRIHNGYDREKYCTDCGELTQRADFKTNPCKCGDEIPPWKKYCGGCGTQNTRFKTKEEALKIFKADD